jgi:hypothetical protein
MDRIVTESGFIGEHASVRDAELSSPACSLTEAPDSYAGYLDEAEIAAELEALRASAKLRDDAISRALDRVMDRLPSQAAPGVAAADPSSSVADRLVQLRARVRDDALHAALGEVLRLARLAEGK